MKAFWKIDIPSMPLLYIKNNRWLESYEIQSYELFSSFGTYINFIILYNNNIYNFNVATSSIGVLQS